MPFSIWGHLLQLTFKKKEICEAGGIAHRVCLACTELSGFHSHLHKLDKMIQDCNLGMEAGGSKAQDRLQPHGNLGASLDFVKLYPEKKEVEEGVVLIFLG